MDFVEHVLKPKYGLVLSLLTGAALRRRGRRDEAARFVVGVPLAMSVTELLKLTIDEHRPRNGDKQPEQSFPSGHATASAAYLLSLAATSRRPWTLGAAAIATAAICASRVRHRAHWPRDVVVGALIGVGGALVGEVLARRIRAQRARAGCAST